MRLAAGAALGDAWRRLALVGLLALLTIALFWSVWIYGNGLRDARYFDGWILAVAMACQLWLHIGRKAVGLSPGVVAKSRAIHIFAGYLVIGVFLSHTELSLPDTAFEWAIWLALVFVVLSGVFGMYLSWWRKSKQQAVDRIPLDRIRARREELGRAVQAAVDASDPTAAAIALPAAPHDAWIRDLYATHLKYFFAGPRNAFAHAIGSERPLKTLTDQIDDLSGYLDQPGQAKLKAIRDLVVEKDRLDFAAVQDAMVRGWLIVHVPVTYTLVVLSVLHIVAVYAFSAGDW